MWVGGGHNLVPKQMTPAVPLPQMGGIIQSVAEFHPLPGQCKGPHVIPSICPGQAETALQTRGVPAAVRLLCAQRLRAIVLGTQQFFLDCSWGRVHGPSRGPES